MEALQWYLENTGTQTLLLVAVDKGAAATPGAWPCRVVGEFTPGQTLPAPAAPPERIARLLSEIGVPANLLGYAYLRTALTLLLEEPDLGRCISRSLYPRIARVHHTAAAGVERAIRHAITQTFARGGAARYRAALGRIASAVGDRPTNSEFLAQAAEHLRLSA